MSYRKKYLKNKIYKIKPKKSILGRLWFWLAVLSSIAIIACFYFLLFYHGFQVENILISGNQKVSNQELENIVIKNATTWFVNFGIIKISTRSIFLVSSKNINKEIIKEFPIIERLETKKKFPKTLILGVIERSPVGIYCSNNEECFLIDQNGVIFEPLIINPGNIAVIKQAITDENVYIGKNIIHKNIMETILKMQNMLRENFHIGIKEAFVTSPLRLEIKTNENWDIFLNIENGSDINLQIIKLSLLLDGEDMSNGRANLHYIDLRPKDRAVICDNDACAR